MLPGRFRSAAGSRNAVVLFLLAACGQEEPAPPHSRGGAEAQAFGAVTYPETPPVVDFAALKTRIDSYHGKILLLDFWATYCAPCIKAFPALAAMQRRHGPAGLRVLTVTRDMPADWDAAVKILIATKANFPCLILADDALDATREYLRVKREWRGEVPMRYLVDRDGAVVAEFFAEATEEDIERVVISLLESKEERAGGI